MKCTKCGNECRIAPEQVGVDRNNYPIYHRHAYCDRCMMKWDIDALPKQVERKKESTMSVWACVLAIFTITIPVAFVLGLVDLGLNDKSKKHTGSWFAVIFSMIFAFFIFITSGADTEKDLTENNSQTEYYEIVVSEQQDTNESNLKETSTEPTQEEIKDKYNVGDTWENETLRMTYTRCYEFTDYNQYNAPADGNKIICAEFEFENIGNSDTTVMYTDFHGYADGYEVNQNYVPDGTGLDFSVKMSAGRKGTGIVAFEVPEDAMEIEIEFSPSFWTSENIIFVYE